MTQRLPVVRFVAALSSIVFSFSACENKIPGPPSETVIYETHVRTRGSVAGNKPDQLNSAGGTAGMAPNTGAGGSAEAGQLGVCRPARAAEAEKLPARSSVTSGVAATKVEPVFVETLWNQFSSVGQCEGCHGIQGQGGWKLDTQEAFVAKMDSSAIERMTSDDPALVMPKGGPIFSKRSPDDPLRAYVKVLKDWLAAGKPPGLFYPPQNLDPKKSFSLPEAIGKTLTNIGNCVPDKSIVATDKAAAQKLDDFFANATALPERLEKTDLVSLDSEVLATQGVIAFAPAYPLWADDAKKIRHVRVPVGKSITYNPTTKNFDIPANTRFYKTFLKQVTDLEGNVSYRKIETRIIVSRPDERKQDGTTETKALFGTYLWKNEDESEAVLQSARLHDGSLFADEIITYTLNEQAAAPILASNSANAAKELWNQGLQRHYAVPGKKRCDQCHEGSPNASFVLGFTPLQIARRPLGEGGTIEAPGEDELTQLERLIDYGVITGMDPTGNSAKLEESQGVRKPRNKYELEAQGYLLGNCSHCHNPRGFPSVSFPELAKNAQGEAVLNFWPDDKDGGIFQFPLERMSPRTKRVDKDGKVYPMPYITPSLLDMGVFENKKMIVAPLNGGSKPPRQVPYVSPATGKSSDYNYFGEPVDAPWRSLIYRNVDTPFTYSDAKALFTHMPLHTSGFDCRAPKIVGNWMVSIPAHLKGEFDDGLSGTGERVSKTKEYWLTSCATTLFSADLGNGPGGTGYYPLWVNPSPTEGTPMNQPSENRCRTCAGNWCLDPEIKDFGDRTQPYVEILPTATSLRLNSYTQRVGGTYAEAVAEAEERLKIYQAGERYNYCPETKDDILDPEVKTKDESGKVIVVPREKPPVFPQLPLGVPSHPHFIASDSTQIPGPWVPRRGDWQKVLSMDPNADPLPAEFCRGEDCPDTAIHISEPELATLKLLQSVRISPEFKAFATTDFPHGKWLPKPECNLNSQKTVDWFRQQQAAWQWTKAERDLSAPVYTQSPGGAVFEMICSNCHGRLADSNGKLADGILDLTGGETRVADLRDGLLGPADMPGQYRETIFKSSAQAFPVPLGTDDLAGRYVAWMGLGGTQAQLPPPILQRVGSTPVFGAQRELLKLPEGTPNMLEVAIALCREVLPGPNRAGFDPSIGGFSAEVPRSEWSLFNQNGDAEMWQKLCGWSNPPPVRGIELESINKLTGAGFFFGDSSHLYDAAAYPASAPVGTHEGTVTVGISSDNRFPWCLRPKGQNTTEAEVAEYASTHLIAGQPMPICPPALFSNVTVMDGVSVSSEFTGPRQEIWARRGAINAGLAVFLYLDGVSKGTVPKPAWDQCENLGR